MTKRVLLVIASEGFQGKEYRDTKKVLEKAGYFVVTASDQPGNAKDHEKKEVDVDLQLSEVDAKNYDGIFLIGGPKAMEHLDTPEMYGFLRTIDKETQLYGAICISPRIFINANLVSGKYFTGWNGDKKLQEIADNAGLKYVDTKVVTDGNFITATGPESAEEFGQAIVENFTDNF